MEVKRVLVTGSEGYIGAVLVPKLQEKNYRVTGVDVCYFGKFNRGKNFQLINKDIRKIDESELENIYTVVHLAGISNDSSGNLKPAFTREINQTASIGLAKKAKAAGVRKFIFSSSCSVYGFVKNRVVDESSLTSPLTIYATSKRDTEKELLSLADKSFCVSIMRNSTVHGFSPSFRNDLVVNNLVTSAVAEGEIHLLSDGTPWRPLIDVRDLSNIFIAFIEADCNKVNKKIINVGFNKSNVQVKTIAKTIKKQLSNCKIIYGKMKSSDVRSYKVNFARFKKLFPNVEVQWPLAKSIGDLVKKLTTLQFSKSDYEAKKYERISVLKKRLFS